MYTNFTLFLSRRYKNLQQDGGPSAEEPAMKSTLFFTLLLSALLSVVRGGTGVDPYISNRHYREMRLFPTRHPEHDAVDTTHLKPTSFLEFHYHDPAVPQHIPRSFATVRVDGFNAPAVNLENSDHISSVRCDKNNMFVAFNNDEAWNIAAREWSSSPKLVMIAFRDTCGEGTASGQRSFHMVSDMKSDKDKRQISFSMSTVPLEAAVHPEKYVTIDVAGYRPNPDSDRQRRYLSPRGDGDDKINDGFDDALDETLGLVSPMDDDDVLSDLLLGEIDDERLVPRKKGGGKGKDKGKDKGNGCSVVLKPAKYLSKGGTSSDPCPKASKSLFSKVKKLGQKFKGLFSKFKKGLGKVVEYFSESSKILKQVLSKNGYSPAGSASFDTNVTHPMIYTDAFGSAYKVYSLSGSKDIKTNSGDTSTKAGLDIYCVGCRANGYIRFEAHFQFEVKTFSFKSANARITDGALVGELGLGATVDVKNTGSFKYEMPTTALSPLNIPGILIVGPSISFSVDAMWKELAVTGNFIARAGYGWKNLSMSIDFLDSKNSQAAKWISLDPTPTFGASVKGKATFESHFSSKLLFGIDIFKGKFKANAGIEANASMPISAEGSASTSGKGTSTCDAKVSLDLDIKLAFITEYKGTKQTPFGTAEFKPGGTFPLKKCVPAPDAKADKALIEPPPVPETAMLPNVPGLAYRKIISEKTDQGTFQILWQPDDKNLYVVPVDDKLVDSSEVLESLLFLTKEGEGSMVSSGTADGRFFHTYGDIVNNYDKVKASRIRLGKENEVPKGSVLLTFRSDMIDDKQVIRAVTPKSDVDKDTGMFYLVGCVYKEKKKLAKVFIVGDDIEAGINYLMAQPVVSADKAKADPPPLKDADFESCFLLSFNFDDQK
ncbi:hypothetical protein VNI00_010586 [Paramarasmius palmivorus]|uniref:Uncharacterized protein n=1 Tax=Paramarasmius palmivorus TaxID=297713 RepID=A0AAW0CGT2_9AGAR